MEMVFRKIEVWIEGSPANRKKLDNAPWTRDKILKKTGKHTAFILISFLISNTFLAYIIGSGALLKIITEPISDHLIGFGSICAFTVIFYAVYSQIREQVCTLICPYGRLQGVMIDKHTVVVAYHDVRGEPRGKLERNPDPLNAKGDCVDCKLCVEVCPTGIDIRNGTQMECVNCTACIDACNEVMIKINRPINLIGFYSESMIRTKEKFSFSGRMIAYSSVIAILLSVLCYFIFSRTDIDITIMRSAGTLYQEQPGGKISNIYNAEIINKTNKSQFVTLEPIDPSVTIKYIQAPGNIAYGGSVKTIFFVIIPAATIHTLKTDVRLRLVCNHKIIQTVSTTFLGPINE
jgi:cytochrome c oxidase accessory protein FixG